MSQRILSSDRHAVVLYYLVARYGLAPASLDDAITLAEAIGDALVDFALSPAGVAALVSSKRIRAAEMRATTEAGPVPMPTREEVVALSAFVGRGDDESWAQVIARLGATGAATFIDAHRLV